MATPDEVQLHTAPDDFLLNAPEFLDKDIERDYVSGPFYLTDEAGNKLTDELGNFLIAYNSVLAFPIQLNALPDDFSLNTEQT